MKKFCDKRKWLPDRYIDSIGRYWWHSFSIYVISGKYKRVYGIGKPPNQAEPEIRIYKNPLLDAYHYKDLIEKDPGINTQADIASKLGYTRARISQIMALLRLHPDIQKELMAMTDQKEIKYFCEKRLRELTYLEFEEQLKLWRK